VVVVFDEAEERSSKTNVAATSRPPGVGSSVSAGSRRAHRPGSIAAGGAVRTSGPRSNIDLQGRRRRFDPLICGAKLLGINLPPTHPTRPGRAKIGNHESYVQGLWLANPSAEPGDDDYGDTDDRTILDRLKAERPPPRLFPESSPAGDLRKPKESHSRLTRS